MRYPRKFFISNYQKWPIERVKVDPEEIQELIAAYCKKNPVACIRWRLPERAKTEVNLELTDEEYFAELDGRNQAFTTAMNGFLREVFHFQGELDNATAKLIAEKLSNIQNFLTRLTYWSEILYSSTDKISNIAPSLKELIESILPRIALLYYRQKNIEPLSPTNPSPLQHAVTVFHKYGNSSVDPIALTIFPPEETADAQFMTEKGTISKIILSHELLHLVTHTLLREEGDNDLKFRSELMGHEYQSSLDSVINEGVSIAFELEYCRTLLEDTKLPEPEKVRVQEYYEARKTVLRESLKLWQLKARQALLGREDTSEASDSGMLAYAEGTRLATKLHRQGWTLPELPELLGQIKQILQKELKTDNYFTSFAVPVSKSPDSVYVRVCNQITQLKPTRLTG